jgi:hypothetical protein
LLPWYVNDTLHDKELALVQTHLKSCLTCNIELTDLHKLSSIISDTSPFAPSIASSYSKLRKRLSNTDETLITSRGKPHVYPGIFQFLKKLHLKPLLSGQRTLALTTVCLLAVLLIKPLNFSSTQYPINNFYTLSSSNSFIAKADEIRVVFSENIKQAQIDKILTSVQGQIINEPNEQGVFTIRFDETITDDDIDRRVSLLRKIPSIIFVEPGIRSQASANSK